MKSILFLVETIKWEEFGWLDRKKEKIFLNIFEKRWPSGLMYFQKKGPQKKWLDKRLKSPVWDDPSTGNMVNGSKHWFNLNSNSFTIFLDNCEGNWVGKSHS